MGISNEDFVVSVEKSRAFFLRHLNGLRIDQIDWKPYPECKNVIETLQHLIVDDRMALESMKTMREPDYGACVVTEKDFDLLLDLLDESHRELVTYLRERIQDQPLEASGCAWGSIMPLPLAISYLCSEDFFHAGQVSFIRMATDPEWDYYGSIYGTED